jgi:hypothetical protein
LAAARLEEGTRGVNLAAGWAVEEMAVGLGLAAPLVEVASSHQVVVRLAVVVMVMLVAAAEEATVG